MQTKFLLRRIWIASSSVLLILLLSSTVPVFPSAPKALAANQQGQAGAAPTTFNHPGVLDSKAHLDFVKQQVHLGAEPWKSAFTQAMNSRYASLSWTPKARATVECGPFSNPNLGCSDERADAAAAYTDALIWYISGDTHYANKAIEILDAWSAVIKDHTGSNAPLQTGWAGSVFPSAAEIIRSTPAGWSQASISRFQSMLSKVYLPEVIKGLPLKNGNWELTTINASLAISVFLDDRASFNKAIAMWRARVPAYFYLTTDGPLPHTPPGSQSMTRDELIDYWQGQSTFVDGLAQETCRDFTHTQYGLTSAINGAEIAYNQGVDLYREEATRLTEAMEFHADYLLGKPVPSWLCDGKLTLKPFPAWEIAYNHYHNVMSIALPLSQKLTETQLRPTGVEHLVTWETLTHAEVG
jgi:hypothetical protein